MAVGSDPFAGLDFETDTKEDVFEGLDFEQPQSPDIPLVTEDLQPVPPEPYQFQKDSPFVSQDPKQLLNATSPPQPSGYEIDGKPLSREEFKSRLHDDDFVEQLQTGNAQLNFPQDEEMEALINRQRDAGSRTQDKWDYFVNGVYNVGAGVTGMESFFFNVVREGLAPLGVDLPKTYQELKSEWASKDFKKLADKQIEKTRVYEDGFLESISNGDYLNAADQAFNMIAQSAPITILAAATGGTGGVGASLATISAVSASSEYAGSDAAEYKGLTNAEKLARSAAIGAFEGIGESVSGSILAKNFNLVKIGLKNTVKKAAEVGGEQAAQAVATELGKKVPIEMFKEFGVDILKEGGSETVTELGQMFTDDLMGVKDYTAGDYLYNGLEAGALGAVGGSVMGLPTAGMGIKRYADERIKKTKGEDLKARVEQRVKDGVYTQSEADKIIVAVDNRVEAVNSVPDEMVSNTEVVDLVNQKQDLEKETIDPVLAPIQNAKIKAIDVQIQEKVAPILEAQAEMDEIMKEVEAEKKKKGEEKAMNRKLKLYDKLLKDETLDPVERRIIKAKKEIVEEKITKKEDSEVPLQKEVVAEKTVSETKPDPLEELDRQLKEMDEAEAEPVKVSEEQKITENVKEEKGDQQAESKENEVQVLEENLPVAEVIPEAPKAQIGKSIEPNKGVSASASKAVEEVIRDLNPDLKPMEGTMLHSAMKGEDMSKYTVEYADEVSDMKLINAGDGLKGQIFKKLQEKGYVEEINTDEYAITPKGEEFVNRVNARHETRKAVKAGTDLFPKEAGIPDAEFQKRKAAKDKVDAATEAVISFAKKNKIISDDPNLTKNSFFDLEKAIRLVGEAIKKGIDIHGDVKRAVEEAIDRFKNSNFYKKLNPESQAEVEKTIRSEHEPKVETKLEGERVRKTLVGTRAYEGDVREGVKSELKEIGLDREIDDFATAAPKAKEFIEKVGEEMALEAVKNGDVEGATAAFVWHELSQSIEKKLALAKDPAEVKRLEKLEADLLENWGNKQWRAGAFNSAMQQILEVSDLGFNLQRRISEYKEKNKGEIPADVEKRFREYDAQLKELKTKIAEAEERAKKAEEDLAVANIKEDVERKKNVKKENRFKLTDAEKAEKNNLRKELFSQFNDITNVLKLLADKRMLRYGKLTAKEAAFDFTEFSKKAIEDFGDKIKPILKDLFEKSTDKKVTPEGVTKDKLSIPHSLIRDFVERGIDNIEDLTKAVHEKYPEATEREVRDAITGYGKTVNPNMETIEADIRKMKRIGRVISALEDVQNKKRPLRSGVQRDKLDAQERALNKELREAMKELPLEEADMVRQQKSQLEAAKTRIKNSIEDLQREIDKGELVPKSTRSLKEDAELRELRVQRDKLKEEHEKIFKDEEFNERKRLEQTKERTKKSIEDLQRRLREKDFAKKARKPVIEDNELTKLRAEKIRVKEEWDNEVYLAERANRTKWEKRKEGIWDAWGLTRMLVATGEWSFVGIQGLTQTIRAAVTNPRRLARAFGAAWNNFTSETKTQHFIDNIKAQDYFPDLKKSELSITEATGKITKREEGTISRWAHMVWNAIGTPFRVNKKAFEIWSHLSPFKAFERASVGYLNTLRIERWLDGKRMLERKEISMSDNPEAYKQMADVVNTLTSRASLGAGERIADGLTKLIFSPRNWASAFKTATPYAFYHFGKMRAGAKGWEPSVAQKMAIADLSIQIGLTTSLVLAVKLWADSDDDETTSVETDPRSSDFMKIKIGDIRIDPWGGKIQQVVLTSRIMAEIAHDVSGQDIFGLTTPNFSDGGMKTKTGEIVPLGTPFKSKTMGGTALQMGINKLSPSASLIENYLTTEETKAGVVDAYGNPYVLSDELKESLYPMYWGTINDLKKDGVDALDAFLMFYAFFGGGIQIPQKKEKKKSATEPAVIPAAF